MSGRFAAKVALVTGGSNGLGRAITQAFLAESARVGILDLEQHAAFDDDDRVLTVMGDVADPDNVAEAMDTVVERWGAVDCLINDAAAYPDDLVLDMPLDAWRRVWDVNMTGVFLCCRAFARHRLARGGGGKIVSISSGSARSPRPAGAAYAASKAALETFSRTLAMELGPHRINVNVVAPGYIDVRGWSDCFPDRAPDDLRAALVRSIPLGQAGRPTDIANAVTFLCSEEASHITGAVLDVDGGSLAGRFTITGA
jgi:NAD(P)-dependent dehydrogenase (short-subunit alcohol dehydrogenase family)